MKKHGGDGLRTRGEISTFEVLWSDSLNRPLMGVLFGFGIWACSEGVSHSGHLTDC